MPGNETLKVRSPGTIQVLNQWLMFAVIIELYPLWVSENRTQWAPRSPLKTSHFTPVIHIERPAFSSRRFYILFCSEQLTFSVCAVPLLHTHTHDNGTATCRRKMLVKMMNRASENAMAMANRPLNYVGRVMRPRCQNALKSPLVFCLIP